MRKWISPEGQIVETKTIKEFAEKFGVRESTARRLACGDRNMSHGWCSTHRRARKARERFMTVLRNTKTGERKIVGQFVTRFATENGLCINDTYGLLSGRLIMYKHWVVDRAYQLTTSAIGDRNF